MAKRIHGVVGILILASFFYGCPYNPIPPRNDEVFFTWARDGSGIVAVKQNLNDDNNHPIKIVILDLQGNEVQTNYPNVAVSLQAFPDKLFLTEQGDGFFAQADTNIYIIDIHTGIGTFVISGEKLISSSPSGRFILTSRYLGKDSLQLSTVLLETGITRTIGIRKFLASDFYPYGASSTISFMNDSVLVGCYSNSGLCSLAFFDTAFNIQYTTNQQNQSAFPSYASGMNTLIYLSGNVFSTLDLNNHAVKSLVSAPSNITSLNISTAGDFFTYTVNSKYINSYVPGSAILHSINTGQDSLIMSDIASSAQISPDNKKIAFFTRGDNAGVLHIFLVP